MAGIQGEFKNGYPFTPYVNLIEYENLTYSSIDLTGNVSGSAEKYTAAGFSYDTVNTFATAVEVDGNVTLGVITAALEDLAADTTYYVRGYTTVGGVKKYTKRYWYFSTPVAPELGTLNITDLSDTTLKLNCSYTVTLDTGDSVKFQQSADAKFTTPSNIVATVDTVNKTFSADVTGLTSGTTYYYRACITLVGDTTNGTATEIMTDWTVNVTEGTNGFTSCVSHIPDGEDLLIAIAPDETYMIDTLLVNNVDKTAEIVNGYYTAQNVSDDVVVVSSFKPFLSLTFDNIEDKQLDLTGTYGVALDAGDSVGFQIDTVNTFDSVGLITISDASVDVQSKTFTKTYNALAPGETYFVRPYTTLGVTTTYGDIDTFTMAWELTAPDPTNGVITLNPSNQSSCCNDHFYIEDGDALTVTLTPDANYEVNTFTVDLVDKKADLDNGVYSVTAVTANMSFVVTYSLIN